VTSFELIKLAVVSSIFLTVLGLGLSATWRDATFLLRERGLLFRSLVSMFVVMPVVVAVVAQVSSLPEAVKIALVALAIAPVPPILPKRELQAGGHSGYAVGLLVVGALIAIVYVPLAVGGHVDHRLVHEAGYHAMPEAPGREVFFYEDRPYAFLPGAVWMRLGQLGARLPPAAQLSEGTGLLQYLLRFQMSTYVRAHARGLDRLRCSGSAFRQWLDARGWHPRRAAGPRFQPVEHLLEAPAIEVAREMLAWHAARLSLCTSAPHARPSHPAAVPRLKRRDENERYWLLLPPLEGDRMFPGQGFPGTDSVRPAVTVS